MKYLIANWKAQMTLSEIMIWTSSFSKDVKGNDQLLQQLKDKKLQIIICPPFPFLMTVNEELNDLPNVLSGAQAVSSKEEGKYTGEVTANALSTITKYALVGHSERRQHFHESDNEVQEQLRLSKKALIEPILCVRGTHDIVHPEAQLVAYEPSDAIGTGNNAKVSDVLKMKADLNLLPPVQFLYGASVDLPNMKGYLETGEIAGLLVGTASLDARRFYQIATYMI